MSTTHRNDAAIAESDERGQRELCRSLVDRLRGRGRKTERPPGPAVEPEPDIDSVMDLDDRSFFSALDDHVSVVDFWAPWCGPCTQLHPLFDARASEHSGGLLQFARVNVDESPGIASAFDVMGIPTIIVIDADGHEIEREVGLPSKRRLGRLVRNATSIADELTGDGAP